MQNFIKKNLLTKIIISFGILLIVVGIVIFFIYFNKPQIPQEDTFYSALYNNDPVLFYKYEGMNNDIGHPLDPTTGVYVPYANPTSSQKTGEMLNAGYVNFQKLQNPKKLFTFERQVSIENLKLTQDKSYLVLSLLGGTLDDTNYIFQVNLNTSEGEKVWQHTLRSGNPPLNQGFAYITDVIPNRYVVFNIIQGNPSPYVLPKGTVVLNMQTGKEKILGVVSNIQLSINHNTISFKKIGQVKTPCVKNDPICFAGDTYKYTYLPTGQLVTQQLP